MARHRKFLFRKIWSKYQFELGTSVTVTALWEKDGDTYLGDSAGNVWKYDLKDPQYADGSTEYTANTYFKTKLEDFGTELVKRLRYVNVKGRSRLGGSYDIKIYSQFSETAAITISVTLPPDEDLTVDEATMDVDDAVFAIDNTGANLKLHRAPLEGQTFMIGVENIDLNSGPMLFHSVKLVAALLSRWW